MFFFPIGSGDVNFTGKEDTEEATTVYMIEAVDFHRHLALPFQALADMFSSSLYASQSSFTHRKRIVNCFWDRDCGMDCWDQMILEAALPGRGHGV